MTTLTTVVKPTIWAPKLKVASYQLLLDSSYPTNGEIIDLSADFDFIYAITFGGNDTLADNQYLFAATLPSATTAITATNILISCHLGGDTSQVLEEEGNTTDLSAVGQLSFTVYGS